MENLDKDLDNEIVDDENATTEENNETQEETLEENNSSEEVKEKKDNSDIISIDDVIRNLSKNNDEEETEESEDEEEDTLDITKDNVDKITVEDVMESEDEAKKKAEEEEKKAQEQEDEDRYDPNALPTVLARIEAGLIGTLRLKDNMNAPIFRKGDFIHFAQPNRIEKKDFILYSVRGEYFIRRIIRFDGLDIYVAGDSEKEYHIVHKEDIAGKAIGRQRRKKYLSLSLNPKHKLYTFGKVNLAYFRLKNRVTSYDNDVSEQAFENAMEQMQANQAQLENVNKPEYDTTGIDLDSDLQSFLDPDELVRQLNEANRQQAQEAETIEEIQYIEVDEEGNEIVPGEENTEQVEQVVEENDVQESQETQEEPQEEILESQDEEVADESQENDSKASTEPQEVTSEAKPKPKVAVKKINLKK